LSAANVCANIGKLSGSFRLILGEPKMIRKNISRRAAVFSVCFLIFVFALFPLSLAAQDETKQSQPKRSGSCKPGDYLCEEIVSLTKEIISNREQGYWVSNLYYERGNIYFRRGEYKNALSDAAQCIKANPRSTHCFIFRGSIYLKLAQYEDAFEDFDKSINQSSGFAEAFYGRGAAYYHKGDYEPALADLDHALQLNRRHSGAYYYRALLLAERGAKLNENAETYGQAKEEYKKAVEDLTSVIEIDLRKVKPEVFLKRARAYEALGDIARAEADRKTYEELTKKP
jgi:tetratricopeptide (TPR) repeat protein